MTSDNAYGYGVHTGIHSVSIVSESCRRGEGEAKTHTDGDE